MRRHKRGAEINGFTSAPDIERTIHSQLITPGWVGQGG